MVTAGARAATSTSGARRLLDHAGRADRVRAARRAAAGGGGASSTPAPTGGNPTAPAPAGPGAAERPERGSRRSWVSGRAGAGVSAARRVPAAGAVQALDPTDGQPRHRRGRQRPRRSEEHTSELQSRGHLVCRLLLEKKKHIYNDLLLLKNKKNKHNNTMTVSQS